MATEAAAIGVWDLALPSNELQWSNRCNAIFGLPLDAELTYKDFLDRVHPEDRSRVDGVVQTVLGPEGTGDYDLEYRVVRPNREVRWVAARGKAQFRQEAGKRVAYRFMGTLLDRTEQKQTQLALLDAEKLAVIGRLAASIAHEIRSPLDAISNLLYLLKGEESEQQRAHYLVLAEEELERAAHIASNTLRFYRDPAAAAGERYDAAELIDSVLSLLTSRIRQCEVRLRTRVASAISLDLPPGEVRQVVINLLNNALDALRPGGELHVRMRRVEKVRPGAVMLTVADTGAGMSSEVRSRIFEAFYTTKQAKGNGIGLWLSLEILKKHGGSMRVRSAAGRGTVFSVFLVGA